MSDRKKMQAMLDRMANPDEPVVIQYANGTSEALPSVRRMIEDQMKALDEYDRYVANGYKFDWQL